MSPILAFDLKPTHQQPPSKYTPRMTQLPTSSPTCTVGWSDASVMAQPQETLNYFSHQGCVLSSAEMLSLDRLSNDEQPYLPHMSSPNNFPASPSSVSFSSSPPVTAKSQQCNSMSLAYLSLSAASPAPDVTSISLSGPYPDVLLGANVLEELAFGSGRYHLTAQTFDQSTAVGSSRAQLTRSPPMNAHDAEGVPLSTGPWPDTLMPSPHRPNLAHPHQHSTEPRSLSHWHPYNRQQTATPYHPGPFQDYGVRQISAPSSPILSPSVSSVDSPAWLPAAKHRRTVSAGHSQPDEYDRRFSEGDVLGNLVPDFSASLSFLSPEPASSASPPQSVGQHTFSNSLHHHPEGFVVFPTNSTSGTMDSSAVSTVAVGSGSNTPGVYKCEYEGCTKSFSRPYNLNSHIRTHTNLRPHRCDHCDRQFARLHDKNRHERLHRGVRPFACERCQHHFARMDALNRHLKVEGGRNLCNRYLIEKKSPNAMPIVDLPPKKINPLILAHFPNFGKEDDSVSSE